MPSGIYIRTKKHSESIRNGHLGKPHPHKGALRSVITRKKISETRKKIGYHTSTEFKKGEKPRNFGRGTFQKGHKGYLKHPNKTSFGFGKDNPNWCGGKLSFYQKIRKCLKYKIWRFDIFTRDDFTCQKCGIRGGKIEAHHKEPFIVILKKNKIKTLEGALNCEELWNLNNGETLCGKCHPRRNGEKI